MSDGFSVQFNLIKGNRHIQTKAQLLLRTVCARTKTMFECSHENN